MPPFMITVTLIEVSTSKLMLTKAGKNLLTNQNVWFVTFFALN